jgi:hypothetical protein
MPRGLRPGGSKANIALIFKFHSPGISIFIVKCRYDKLLAGFQASPLPSLPAYHFAINVRSHIGKKIARAKKPTTAASPMVKIGPMASDNFFMAYSTSVS